MRTLTTSEDKLLASGNYAVHAKVEIKDSGGTWRDMRALEGQNWIEEVSYSESVDQPVGSAEVVLKRAAGQLNLATLVQGSKLNTLTGSYAPLCQPGRELKISTATVPPGVAPSAWVLVFHGFIDDVAIDSDGVRLACRDLGGVLQDLWCEQERIYGLSPTYQYARTWTASYTYLNGEAVAPTAPDGAAYMLFDVSGGTGSSGTSEPVWPTVGNFAALPGGGASSRVWGIKATMPGKYGATPWAASTAFALGDVVAYPYAGGARYLPVYCSQAGTTASVAPNFSTWNTAGEVTDGTAKWRQLGQCLDVLSNYQGQKLKDVIFQILLDNGCDSTLDVPVAPTWMVLPWTQSRTPVLDAITTLAMMIGWTVRYRWSASASAFRLTLFQPDRSKAVPDRTLGPQNCLGIRNLSVSRAGVRNVIAVVYSDSSTLQANGVDYVRKTVTVSDATSISKYGRRWAEATEASASQVKDATTAAALANAVLSDLKEPLATQEAELQYMYCLELGDLLRFTGNSVHWDGNTDLAVVGIQHRIGEGQARTIIQCRGRPSGGFKQWHNRFTMPGVAPSRRIFGESPPYQVTVTNYAGRSAITFKPTSGVDSSTELYVSASNPCVPSLSTYEGRTTGPRFDVFRAAGTYYAVLVARSRDGVASSPSAQVTLVPT